MGLARDLRGIGVGSVCGTGAGLAWDWCGIGLSEILCGIDVGFCVR